MSANLEAEAAKESAPTGAIRRAFAKRKPLPAGIELQGQTAIVTGSNTGLGFEACRLLLKLGLSSLVMGVRSQARGDQAAKQLRGEFPAATVAVWLLDMDSYDSVRQFAESVTTLPRLDIAILNAGMVKASFATSPGSGHELNLTTNYLSSALLATLLLPILKSKKPPGSSRPSVLSVVGSDTMYDPGNWPKVEGPVLQQWDDEKNFKAMIQRYASAKLLLAVYVSRLAEFVDPADVLVNTVNPGATKNTGLTRDAPFAVRMVFKLAFAILGRTAESGASIYLDGALAQGPESHGSFISDWAIKPFPKFCYTEQGQAFKNRLWDETMEEFNLFGASAILQGLKRPS
jgi:NAD(P)-dependent dehydrogenase (short-subunit alcohol dehydrogenase family)